MLSAENRGSAPVTHAPHRGRMRRALVLWTVFRWTHRGRSFCQVTTRHAGAALDPSVRARVAGIQPGLRVKRVSSDSG